MNTDTHVYECVGGPLCGKPIVLHFGATGYVMPGQGWYRLATEGYFAGKLLWRDQPELWSRQP